MTGANERLVREIEKLTETKLFELERLSIAECDSVFEDFKDGCLKIQSGIYGDRDALRADVNKLDRQLEAAQKDLLSAQSTLRGTLDRIARDKKQAEEERQREEEMERLRSFGLALSAIVKGIVVVLFVLTCATLYMYYQFLFWEGFWNTVFGGVGVIGLVLAWIMFFDESHILDSVKFYMDNYQTQKNAKDFAEKTLETTIRKLPNYITAITCCFFWVVYLIYF